VEGRSSPPPSSLSPARHKEGTNSKAQKTLVHGQEMHPMHLGSPKRKQKAGVCLPPYHDDVHVDLVVPRLDDHTIRVLLQVVHDAPAPLLLGRLLRSHLAHFAAAGTRSSACTPCTSGLRCSPR
jgi:hypothetical protein